MKARSSSLVCAWMNATTLRTLRQGRVSEMRGDDDDAKLLLPSSGLPQASTRLHVTRNRRHVLFFGLLCFLIVPLYLWFVRDTLSPLHALYTRAPNLHVAHARPPVKEATCELLDLDPWDVELAGFLNPNENYMAGCKPQPAWTALQHGRLTLLEAAENGTCLWSCLFPVADREFNRSEFAEVENGTRPDCDLVEVRCFDANTTLPNTTAAILASKETTYEFLHIGVRRNPSLPPLSSPPQKPSRPDVHVIVLDSTSGPQFIRSMPKTIYALREYFSATFFRHHNKVGYNSWPNGVGLFLGKMGEAIPQSPVSVGYASDFPNATHAHCVENVDEEPFIGFRFQDDGYVTSMSEDWASGVFNWPSCPGFNRTPTDHYMRPFQLRSEQNSVLNKRIHGDSCRETTHDLLEWLESLLAAYPDRPVFSISWITELSHGNLNGLYHADEIFYRFLVRHRERFANSYLVFLSDHGLHYGHFHATRLGELEENAASLFLSVPQSRRLELGPVLAHNAHVLTSHYDVYATLIDISQPKKPRHTNPVLYGESLLRPLPTERTCDELRVPLHFCNCRPRLTPFADDDSLLREAASALVLQMNRNLTALGGRCVPLEVSSAVPVTGSLVAAAIGEAYLRLQFTTRPGDGHFNGYVWQRRENGTRTFQLASYLLFRANPYAHQAKCVLPHQYESYCFCNDTKIAT